METSARAGERIRAVHHGDVDGVVSALVLASCHDPRGDDLGVRFTDYLELEASVAAAFADRPQVFYVADLSLPAGSPVFREVAAREPGVRAYWFDHHPSSDASSLRHFDGGCVTTERLCGAELLAREFGPTSAMVRHLVRLARDRDFWINDLPDSRRLEHVLTELGPSETFEHLRGRLADDPGALFQDPVLADACDRALVRLEASHALASSTFTRIEEGEAWGVFFTQGYSNEVAERILDLEHLDAAMMIDLDRLSRRTAVLLRSRNGSVDVSRVGASTGGGGHAAASGTELPIAVLARAIFRHVRGDGDEAPSV